MRTVTQKDIALYCGVSRTAVSFALHNDPQISEETREKILRAAEELGYDISLHQAARRLISQRYGRTLVNHVIALLLPVDYHHSQYFSKILQGIQDVLTEEMFALVIGYLPPDPNTLRLPDIFFGNEIDAVVVFGGDRYLQLMELNRTAKQARNLPGVSLIMRVPGHSSISTDDRSGAYLATRHLLDLGHRHILHTYQSDWGEPLNQRVVGLHQALREDGLDIATHCYSYPIYLGSTNPSDHLAVPTLTEANPTVPGFSHAEFHKFLMYLQEHPLITAILGQNDPYTRRLGYLLKQAGYAIPGDVNLVGFDDTDPMLDEHGMNILTTVQVPLVEVGREAARAAINSITPDSSLQEIILPVSLVVRSSTSKYTGPRTR